MKSSEIFIRQEKVDDRVSVNDVVKQAFANVENSDQTEAALVERLRKSKAFIPELSLVAWMEDKIVGHILLTKVVIRSKVKMTDSLALAPVSVLPVYQGLGIGGSLIKEAHRIAINGGHESIVLIGHENYYPRFGYEPASRYQITFPFNVPDKNAMVMIFAKKASVNLKGIVEYPEAFFES